LVARDAASAEILRDFALGDERLLCGVTLGGEGAVGCHERHEACGQQ
jgi:hypothetical protein